MNALFSSTPFRLLTGLVLLMALITLGSIARLNFEKAKYANPMPATVSVSGVGEVIAVPDVGEFSFMVNAKGDDAAAAQSQSATAINDVIAYLTGAGVAEGDIKTTGYNVYPHYRYEDRVCPAGSFCPSGEPIEDGYEASQTVTVKVRNINDAGTLISGVGEHGATNISSLSFTVDDSEAIRAEARTKAIADAEAKAITLANDLGVQLVRFIGYYDESGYAEPYYNTKVMAFEAADQSVVPEMPVGEDVTTVRVNVTYEVR